MQDGTFATGSIDGQQLPYAPHLSGTVADGLGGDAESRTKINFHVESNYNSKQYLALPNENAISQGGYGLLNAA